MSKKVERMISPKLRFSQFIEKKEILEIQLGLIGEFKNGINFSPALKGSGILTVDVYNMYGPGIETKLDSLYRVNIIAEESILKKNDILFVRSSLKREGVGWATLFPGSVEPILFCGFLIRFRINSDHLVDPRYLTYFLRSDNGRKEITNASGTGTITNISQESLKKILAPVPVLLAEQQKIAACLSSLDNLIAAESEKLEVLKEHKKGLLQNLFPGEGESVPRVRFREFEGDGEWEEKKLSELLEFKNGINASKEQYGKGIKFINVLDILNNEFIVYDKIIGSVDIDEATLQKNAVTYGDILFQRSSETQEEVGTANVYLDQSTTATFGGFVIRGKKIAEYNPLFLNTILKTDSIRKKISSKAGGSTRFNVGQETLGSVEINIPSIKEQDNIAECFSSINELIFNQQEKIEKLKLHKKGLLQGLFPTITEEN